MAYISIFTSPQFLAVLAAGGLLLLDPVASTAQAKHDLFDDFPVVIACEYKSTQHAFYLSRVTQDGTATYVASDKIAGTVSIDGKAKAIGGPTGGNCVGKTLEELRSSGQAHDLNR
jgi:hypothetical protein